MAPPGRPPATSLHRPSVEEEADSPPQTFQAWGAGPMHWGQGCTSDSGRTWADSEQLRNQRRFLL